MDYMLWVWIGVVAVSLIVEALSMDMTSIWFAVGGLFSLILWAIIPDQIVWQVAVFLVISALCIIFLRKIAKRILFQKPTVATNIDKMIGTHTKLLESIKENAPGTLKINGVVWTAISLNDKEIEGGTEVEIIQIEGNKMIVKPFIEKETNNENK